MATANNILTTAISAVENPEDILLLAAFGHFLTVVASHNQKTLGGADAPVAEAGSTVTQLASLFSELGTTLNAVKTA